MRYSNNKITSLKIVQNTTNSTKMYRSFEHSTSIPYTNEIYETKLISEKENSLNKSSAPTTLATKSQISKNILNNHTNLLEK